MAAFDLKEVTSGMTPQEIGDSLRSGRTAKGRTEMKAITGLTAGDVVYLSEGGRSGPFEYLVGDYSAEVAADTLEGVYVKLDAVAATVGVLKRVDAIVSDTVTVGAGGDYSTINEAISFLSLKSRTSFVDGSTGLPYRATINLESGFVMSEQVIADGVDLSFIKITATDAVTAIARSALTRTYPNLDYNSTPAFLAVNNGCLPVIGCLFNMDTSGTTDTTKQHGVMAAWGGRAVVAYNCGITNVTGRGLYLVNGYAYARFSNFSGAGTYGCRPGNGSVVNIRDSNFSNCGINGLYSASSIVVAVACNFSGAGQDAVQTLRGSQVNIGGDGSDLSGAGRYAIWCRGGTVECDNVDISGYGTRGIQCEGGIVEGDSVVCTSGTGRPVNTVLGGEVKLTNFTISGVTSDSALAAFTGSRISAPSAVLNGTYSGAELAVANGGIINAAGTSYDSNITPNIVSPSGLILNDKVVKNSGAASILSGTASVVISHGLGITPTTEDFSINPVNTTAGAAGWYIGSVNSTTFTISAGATVGSDANFRWNVEIH